LGFLAFVFAANAAHGAPAFDARECGAAAAAAGARCSSAARDAVSPPEWIDDVAAAFRNHRAVVVANGAHVFDGLSGLDTCLDATIIRLFDTGDVAAPDYSCFDAMR
jgi:hypothetical protein